MKKKLLLLALICLTGTWAFAQDSSDYEAEFNKWSIEGGIGMTKPWREFTPGYYTKTPDFLATELGLRYMFSEYAGLKLDFGYNKFSEGDDSMPFETTNLQWALQGVTNLGRIMNFESWTNTLGLLGHGGFGIGYMDYDNYSGGKDWYGSIIAGLTGQVKLSRRVALTLDGTVNYNGLRQDLAFDGGPGIDKEPLSFDITAGITVYLGRHKSHADWYLRDDEKYKVVDSKIAALEERVKDLEDNSATKSELAQTQAGVDELAKEVDALKNQEPVSYDEFVKQLINDGYVSVYFDFNSTKVQGASTNSINFMKAYLTKNPSASIDILGYADELGSDDYNQKLSQKRADAVVKLLTEAGIDGSRLNAVGKGKDASVDKSSAQARQVARRATFIVR